MSAENDGAVEPGIHAVAIEGLAALQDRLPRASVEGLLQAERFSRRRLSDLAEFMSGSEVCTQLANLGVSYVVTGSLGRLEASSTSDIDLVALSNGSTPLPQLRDIDREIRELLRARFACDVSRGENFTGVTILQDIADNRQIGGDADHVNLLTKRVTLLTECRAIVNPATFEQFQAGLLQAFTGSQSTSRRYMVSLCDEIARYYRTLCIDFKSRVDAEMKPWGIRYLKLRHSRKYWFFSLAIGLTALIVKFDSIPDEADKYALQVLNMSPSERLIFALERAGMPLQLSVAAFYSSFLVDLQSDALRAELSAINYDDRFASEAFRRLKRNADRLHRAMLETIESLPANWRRHLISRFLLHP